MIGDRARTIYYFQDSAGGGRPSRPYAGRARDDSAAVADAPSATAASSVASSGASFRERMRAARPDVVARQAENAPKREIAMQLRALRDAKGLTQADVARASGMAQPTVARMEALTGPVPAVTSIERYVVACEGHMALVISSEAIDLGDVASEVLESEEYAAEEAAVG